MPLGELFVSDPVPDSTTPAAFQPVGSGMSVFPGAELAAGIAPATLKLVRGGQIRICPKSKLIVTGSEHGLMLGMGAGSIEVDSRSNQPGTDLLATPDFNLQLAGPSAFHFALGVNSKGDTCFKPLPGNASAVVFSELFGSGTYRTTANEAVVFAGGKLGGRGGLSEPCGCPIATHILQADATAPERPGATHAEVEAPFVFNSRAALLTRPSPVARIQFSSLPNVFFAQEEVAPAVLEERPAEASVQEKKQEKTADAKPKKDKKEKKGWVKRLFGPIFGR